MEARNTKEYLANIAKGNFSNTQIFEKFQNQREAINAVYNSKDKIMDFFNSEFDNSLLTKSEFSSKENYGDYLEKFKSANDQIIKEFNQNQNNGQVEFDVVMALEELNAEISGSLKKNNAPTNQAEHPSVGFMSPKKQNRK